MNSLTDLHKAVQATLASKRLGRPVFVRYLLQGQDGTEIIQNRLAQTADAVCGWVGQPLERLYAAGTLAGGQVSLTLQFRDGATALVGYARGPVRGSGVELLVLGNHGSLFHDAGSADLWDEAPAAPPGPITTRGLKQALERALNSGKPEPVAAEGKP